MAPEDLKLNQLERIVSQWRKPIFPVFWLVDGGICSCGNMECHSPGKHPIINGWKENASMDPDIIRQWHERFPAANWAMPTGQNSGLFVVDIDNHDPKKNGFETWDMLRNEHPEPIETPSQKTGGGGQQLFFSFPAGHDIAGKADALGPGIDTRANNNYVLIPPSRTKDDYIFELPPEDTPLQALPEWILARVNGRTQQKTEPRLESEYTASDIQKAVEALHKLSPSRADNYDEWLRVGMALKRLGPVGLELWDEWSKQSSKWNEGATAEKWKTFDEAGTDPGRVSLGTLLYWAEEDRRKPQLITANEKQKDDTSDVTDIINAERLEIENVNSVFDIPEPLEFLVENLITKGSVNLLVGDPKTKKTWAALDMAVTVAAGEKWLEHQCKQAPVLIIDEESGTRRLRRRLYETMNGHLIKREDELPLYFVSLAGFDARNVDDINELHVKILEYDAGLVVIDSLVDIMLGGNENDPKEVQPVIHNLRHVAEHTQAAILLIHHNNKAGQYRGSTAILAGADLLLAVERKQESKFVNFSVQRARDIETKTFTAAANFSKDTSQFWLSATDLDPKVTFNKGQRYVLRYLSAHGETGLDEIKNNADVCSAETARRSVYTLAESGHVQRTDTGGTGRGVVARYSLTPKGAIAAEGA